MISWIIIQLITHYIIQSILIIGHSFFLFFIYFISLYNKFTTLTQNINYTRTYMHILYIRTNTSFAGFRTCTSPAVLPLILSLSWDIMPVHQQTSKWLQISFQKTLKQINIFIFSSGIKLKTYNQLETLCVYQQSLNAYFQGFNENNYSKVYTFNEDKTKNYCKYI